MGKPSTTGNTAAPALTIKSCLRHALPTLAVLAAWRWSQTASPEADAGGPLVHVEQGVLQGAHRHTHADGIPYFSFQGVPYARPPVGELRFKAPLPPDNWTDVRPALEEGHMCCQPHTEIYWMPPEINKMFLPSLRRAWLIVSSLPRLWSQIRHFWAQQEDCLYLNVYTKQIPAPGEEAEARLSPVLVFVHGGAFYTGTANSHIYGPDFLLREDLVLVTLQYRLGALGFLAPGSREAPGNAGLKDQAAALRWVRANIARFGGDPESVTLVGHSAGGASVHFHTLSPGSRGLFHRAVHLSGSALNPWAYAEPASAAARARRLARLLGCPPAVCDADPDALVRFLRTKTPADIIEASYNVFDQHEGAAGYISPFVPTVDTAPQDDRQADNDTRAVAAAAEVFLRSSPLEAMESGAYWPVPTLAGQNSVEGMIVMLPDIITADMTPSPRNLALAVEDTERVVPRELGLARGSAASRQVADMIRERYLRPSSTGDATLDHVRMYSDILFSIGIGRFMRALTRLSSQPVFFYHFSYDGRLSVVKKLVRSELPGVSHGDELGYLFPVEMMPAEDVRPGDAEIVVRDRWTRTLANFAKFGSPNGPPTAVVDPVLNVSWPPATAKSPRFVDIGADMTLHDGYPVNDAFAFWASVFRAAGRDIGRA